jgi:hypothetical protein
MTDSIGKPDFVACQVRCLTMPYAKPLRTVVDGGVDGGNFGLLCLDGAKIAAIIRSSPSERVSPV